LAKSTPILINFFTDGLPLCGAAATTPWHNDAVEERPSTPSELAQSFDDGWNVAPGVSGEGWIGETASLGAENWATGGVDAVEQDRQQQTMFERAR
jgi:hypothetical protein